MTKTNGMTVKRVLPTDAAELLVQLMEARHPAKLLFRKKMLYAIRVFKSMRQLSFADRNPNQLDRCGGATHYEIDPPFDVPPDLIRQLRRQGA